MNEIERVEARTPHEGEFVRVRPGKEHRKAMWLLRHNGEDYLVGDDLVDEVRKYHGNLVKQYMVFTAMNMEQEVFVWPVEMPVSDDHPAFDAMRTWVAIGFPPGFHYPGERPGSKRH